MSNPIQIRKKYQVAVMVIYVGNSLPGWFRSFSLSVESSGDLIKWLIFVTEANALANDFENIQIIRITRQELYQRLARLDSSATVPMIQNLIEQAPYSLVEFKPCLATIFEVSLLRHYIMSKLKKMIGIYCKLFALGLC